MEYVDSPVSKVFEAHIYSIKPLSMSFTSHLAVKVKKEFNLTPNTQPCIEKGGELCPKPRS
jgi:hypothetical protein